jgi:RNA recognition motif-containing protein
MDYSDTSSSSEEETTQETTQTTEKKQIGAVIVIRHLPEGFFEKQIQEFFAQFCEVKNVRVSRNPKTRKSRGVAFMEVGNKEEAQILVDEMDYYYLGKKTIRVQMSTLSQKSLKSLFSFKTKGIKQNGVKEANAEKTISTYLKNSQKVHTEPEVQHKQNKMEKKLKNKWAALEKKGIVIKK